MKRSYTWNLRALVVLLLFYREWFHGFFRLNSWCLPRFPLLLVVLHVLLFRFRSRLQHCPVTGWLSYCVRLFCVSPCLVWSNVPRPFLLFKSTGFHSSLCVDLPFAADSVGHGARRNVCEMYLNSHRGIAVFSNLLCRSRERCVTSVSRSQSPITSAVPGLGSLPICKLLYLFLKKFFF